MSPRLFSPSLPSLKVQLCHFGSLISWERNDVLCALSQGGKDMYNWQKDNDVTSFIDRALLKRPREKPFLPIPLPFDYPKALEPKNRRHAICFVAQNEVNLIADWLPTRKTGERHMQVDFEAESRSRRLLGNGERMRVSLKVDIW